MYSTKTNLKLYLYDPNRTGNVTRLEIMNKDYIIEPLHARVNTMLVFNLFNICMKSLTCIGCSLEPATCYHTTCSRLTAGGGWSEDSA